MDASTAIYEICIQGEYNTKFGHQRLHVVEYKPDGMQIVEDIFEQIAAVLTFTVSYKFTMGQVCSTSGGCTLVESQSQPQLQGGGTQHAADDGERDREVIMSSCAYACGASKLTCKVYV